MATTVTPTEILNILDLWADSCLANDALVANNQLTRSGAYVYGNGSPTAGTGDPQFINSVMNLVTSAVSTPLQIKTNLGYVQPLFSGLTSWVTTYSGVGGSTLDSYLTYYNTSPNGAVYSYLAEPSTALQYYLCAGQNPLTTTAPTAMLSPANVYAPQVKFGSATVGAAAAITYSDGVSIPTANNALQVLSIVSATGGTFTPTFTLSNGTTVSAAPITYTVSLSAATIQTAVNATSIGSNQITVSGANGGPWTFVLWGSSFSNSLVKTISISSSLTGTGATATVTPTVNAAYTLTVNATGGTLGFTIFGQSGTVAYSSGLTAAALQSAMTGLTSTGTGNVSVTGSNGGPYSVTLTGNLANQYAAPFTVSSASLTGGASTATVQQTALGSQQGYVPTKGLTANVTTSINGTLAVTVTFDGWSAAGAVVTGRTATATLDNLNAGQSAAFSITTSGDRIRHISSIASTSGTATAGAFTLDSLIERTPL